MDDDENQVNGDVTDLARGEDAPGEGDLEEKHALETACSLETNSALSDQSAEGSQEQPREDENALHGTEAPALPVEEASQDADATTAHQPFVASDTASEHSRSSHDGLETISNEEAEQQTVEVENSTVLEDPLPPATARLTAQARLASHSPDLSLEDFKILSRKFNIDLASKLMFARGPLIEAIINANICHYADFRTAERIMTYRDGDVILVPCSRADVFSTDMLSVIEKRFLMKFLSFCLTFDEHPEDYISFSERPFVDFLQHKKLSVSLQHFVLYSIAMTRPSVNTAEGLREAQKFLRSLGRYSNSPFVLTLYGVGELPQAFCRMSAVFGGTYCLRRSARSLLLDKETNLFKGIICTNNQQISAKHIVMEESYLPESMNLKTNDFVSRAILITNKSLKSFQNEPVTLLTIPPLGSDTNSVRVIETGPASMSCPIGLFIVSLTCIGVTTAQEDLQPYVDLLCNRAQTPGEFVFRAASLPNQILTTNQKVASS